MLNRVQLIGNVGIVPEIRSCNNTDDKVATLTLATSDYWKDKQTGEKKQKTEWHRIVCFNQHLLKIIEDYVKKGSKIYIEGANRTRKYKDNNIEKYITEIVLDRYLGQIILLDKKEGVPQTQSQDDYGTTSTVSQQSGAAPANLDDDIPF